MQLATATDVPDVTMPFDRRGEKRRRDYRVSPLHEDHWEDFLEATKKANVMESSKVLLSLVYAIGQTRDSKA